MRLFNRRNKKVVEEQPSSSLLDSFKEFKENQLSLKDEYSISVDDDVERIKSQEKRIKELWETFNGLIELQCNENLVARKRVAIKTFLKNLELAGFNKLRPIFSTLYDKILIFHFEFNRVEMPDPRKDDSVYIGATVDEFNKVEFKLDDLYKYKANAKAAAIFNRATTAFIAEAQELRLKVMQFFKENME